MNNAETTWNDYSRAWSTPGPQRDALLETIVTEEVQYTDPSTATTDRAGLSEYMAQFQARYPGVRFSTLKFEHRGHESLADWQMVDAEGTVLAGGRSYGRYDKNGRLEKMAGFFAATGDDN